MTLMCSEPEAPGACWATGCWSRQRWGPTCAALPSATCGSWTQLAGCGWNGPGAQVRAQERKLLTIDVDSERGSRQRRHVPFRVRPGRSRRGDTRSGRDQISSVTELGLSSTALQRPVSADSSAMDKGSNVISVPGSA
jgi:hypothetical protein